MCIDTIQTYLVHPCHHESPPPSVKAPKSLGQETTILRKQQIQNCLQSRLPQKPNQYVPRHERKLIKCLLGFLPKCDQDHLVQNECALGPFTGNAPSQDAEMTRWLGTGSGKQRSEEKELLIPTKVSSMGFEFMLTNVLSQSSVWVTHSHSS